jgi:hypothetical protein
MGKVLCMIRLHRYGPMTGDSAGRYRTCERCGKVRESHSQGPDGWEQVQRHTLGGGG